MSCLFHCFLVRINEYVECKPGRCFCISTNNVHRVSDGNINSVLHLMKHGEIFQVIICFCCVQLCAVGDEAMMWWPRAPTD